MKTSVLLHVNNGRKEQRSKVGRRLRDTTESVEVDTGDCETTGNGLPDPSSPLYIKGVTYS